MVQPIETARNLVVRITGPQFQRLAMRGAQQELKESQSLVAQATLRGIVLDETTVRLEAVAPAKEGAVALLYQAVLAIQKAHQELLESRIKFLGEVRDGLQVALKDLNESLKDGLSDTAQSPGEQDLSSKVPTSGRRSQLDRLVTYRTRIAALNFVERTIVPTEPQEGFVPVIDGPREANLVQVALLSGLGILFFAVLLTFLLHRSSRA